MCLHNYVSGLLILILKFELRRKITSLASAWLPRQKRKKNPDI